MAKVSKSLSSVDEIFKELSAVNPFGTSNFGSLDIHKNEYWIDSGNWILNAALSGSIKKGFPSTKQTSLVGESGCLPKDEVVGLYILKSIGNYDRKIITEGDK
jgi:hypothetical protein